MNNLRVTARTGREDAFSQGTGISAGTDGNGFGCTLSSVSGEDKQIEDLKQRDVKPGIEFPNFFLIRTLVTSYYVVS